MNTLLLNTLARNTRATYNSGTTAFIKFCIHYRYLSSSGSILPASETTVLLFTTYLSQRVRPSTIKVYLAAVRNLHIQCGFPSPTDKSVLIPRILRGIKRIYGTDRRPRLPITPNILLLFHRHLNIEWQDHMVLWTAMLVAFFGFLRSAELLALRTADIQSSIQPPSSSFPIYIITIHSSKTDPFRQGCSVRLAPSGHHLLCPARALHNLLSHLSITSDSPLFTLSSGSPLSRHTLNSAISMLASYCNLNPVSFSSHSFRIGAATTAATNGLPDSLIKTLGRWSSDAYQSYIVTPTSVLDDVPRQLVIS